MMSMKSCVARNSTHDCLLKQCNLLCWTCIAPQANSILVAGHDTTSFMLTSTLYYVSKHAEVKAKVFAEIDRFGRNRQVTFEDMDKFPYVDVSNKK